MYLWDANIFRHFGEEHPRLVHHIHRVGWQNVGLPSPVVAEVLRGRADYALKATPAQAILAHQLLLKTYSTLQNFRVVFFDEQCAEVMERLQRQKSTRKRYVDCMIAAIVLSGQHVLVTRNEKHFADLLPARQIENWLDR